MDCPAGRVSLANNGILAMLDQSQDCIKIMRPDGRLEFINAMGLRSLALQSLAAVSGQEWGTLWPNATRPVVEAAVTRARHGQMARFQGCRPGVGGEPGWWDVSVSPIRNQDGIVCQILAASRSIAAPQDSAASATALEANIRLLGEERARLSQARAVLNHGEKLRLLGQSAGSIVHDLNNVLAALQGAFAILRRQLDVDAGADILVHVDQAIARGAQLTRHLLDFSRSDTETVEIVDLAELLQNDAGLLRHLVGRSVRLRIDIADASPLVLAPLSQVHSVLFNLVANAADAVKENGDISVRLRGRALPARRGDLAAGRYAVLEIEDNGVGMKPEIVQRLGQAFFTTKASGKGTGLGIPSAFELARMCGGCVEIDSEPGRGSIVRVVMEAAASVTPHTTVARRHLGPVLHGNASLQIQETDETHRHPSG